MRLAGRSLDSLAKRGSSQFLRKLRSSHHLRSHTIERIPCNPEAELVVDTKLLMLGVGYLPANDVTLAWYSS